MEPSQNYYFYNPVTLGNLVSYYALLNPHASFTYENSGAVVRYRRTAPACDKWVASAPTSAHWYSPELLRTLIAANLKAGRDITVREFVSEFRGLSSTGKQKAVTGLLGLSGERLSSMVNGDDLSMAQIGALLAAMKEQSQPVKPQALGVIGAEHVTQWLVDNDVEPETVEYRTERGDTVEGLPFVVECAFGVRKGDGARSIVTGLNWTPTISIPSHSMGQWISNIRVESGDPVVVFVHIACPRFSFTDRGKTSVGLDDSVAGSIERLLRLNGAKWEKLKKKEDQAARAQQRMWEERERQAKRGEMSIKEACHLVMVDALNSASDGGRLPAQARQVMYAARRLVQEHIGDRWVKNDKTFTQGILPDWMSDNPETAAAYDVVYDDRGRFTEPHNGESIGVGTISVRQYMRRMGSMIDTGDNFRPGLNYSAVLFIEKEGFQHTLREAGIANRYDVAMLSTKGFTVTAARMLAEKLTAMGVKILVLHDFDKAGLEIEYSFRNDNRRWTFDIKPDIIDIGVRLPDVESMNLTGESVTYKGDADPRVNLCRIGASKEERDYLVSTYDRRHEQYKGRRVELNAMTARQLVDFIEDKLQQCGVKKVMAGKNVLTDEYKSHYKDKLIEKRLEAYRRQIEKELADFEADVPDDLRERVEELCVTGKSAITWELAVESVVSTEFRKNEDESEDDTATSNTL